MSRRVVRLRLVFGDEAMFGPGKADLLRLIGETGSIAEAGRRMGMSYRRAWGLVEELNRAFREPLVMRARGGAAEHLAAFRALAGDGRPPVVRHIRRTQNLAGIALARGR